MPGKIKVKVLAGRNLPVMDRAGDTTDAFVEIKFGGVTHKTDVCRKSLNPHWSSTEWYRFEVDESELQDEPLQLRLMDHDTYSANDAIGKVVISLAPLLAREANNAKGVAAPPGGAVMSGWIPVFDTMHGIRGELNVIVKVELFSDFNKYKTSSCGVQFFHCSMIPPGYRATAVHGFVEELVVNDDPEYQWIDKIRTPRASNEARQVAFIKLSNQVQRLVGLKAAELGANAVIGYQQDFDLEGEAGVVARAIGTAVSIAPLPTPSQPINIPPCTQQQLRKYLDILATDAESITDLNQYFQHHQDELKNLLNILNPKTPALLDDPNDVDLDDDKSVNLTRQSSVKSYAGSVSIYQDDYVAQNSMRHLSEDQTDLNKLLKGNDNSDSDSTGPLQTIKKIKTNFFKKRFGSMRSRKSDKQEDQISLQSNSSDTSRISLNDIKNEFQKLKRLKKPKFRKGFANKLDEGVGMASILARSVIHAHTSLACIAETQDSEHSPCSTMRQTSESEPTINTPEDMARIVSAETGIDANASETKRKVPELHTSLKNIDTKETDGEKPQRKLSESCPTSPMVSRSDNLLKLPEETGYFGSISLSGESSDVYTSSEEDDESSDQKTDTEKSVETTSSVVQSVLNNHGVNSVFIAQMDRKLSSLEGVTPEPQENTYQNVIKEDTQDFSSEESESSASSSNVHEIENNENEKIEGNIDKTSPLFPNKNKKLTPKSNSLHFKFHNPFSHKKVSKSISAPSSPVEKTGFIYRSSRKIKNKFSKFSKSSMIKSLSHYSLIPKKKNVDAKTTLSQPGSTTDVPSKAPSDTVLGSPFLSYTDLLSLDKETSDIHKPLHKSDEIGHSKVTMYIGSEPASRASLSGPSSIYHGKEEDSFNEHKLQSRKSSIKPTGLIHTAMETILIDKVQSLLVPTSPDLTQSKEQQFFDDVNEKLEKVEEDRINSQDHKNLKEELGKGRRRTNTDEHLYLEVGHHGKEKPKKHSLVHTAIETILMDKVQSLLIPTTPDTIDSEEKQLFYEGNKKSEKVEEATSRQQEIDDRRKTSLAGESSIPKNKSDDQDSLMQSAMKTMLIDRVQTLIPTSSESIIPHEHQLLDDNNQKPGNLEKNKKNTLSSLIHTAMETMLMDKMQSLLPPVPLELIDSPEDKESELSEKDKMSLAGESSIRKHKSDDHGSLIQSAMKTILIDRVQALIPKSSEPIIPHEHQLLDDNNQKSGNLDKKNTRSSLIHTAMETMLMDKMQSLLPPVPLELIDSSDNKESEQSDKDNDRESLVNSAMETLLLDKVHSLLVPTSTNTDNMEDGLESICLQDPQIEELTNTKDKNGRILMRQDSIHSAAESNESRQMSKEIDPNIIPCKVTQTKPVLQHFHPILGGVASETIPSLPETSFDQTESLDIEGVEQTCDAQSENQCLECDSETNSASVCDNSHAACRFDRNEKEKEKCDKEKGSPRHARHESYGGREPVVPVLQTHNSSLNASSTPMGIHRRSSDSDLSVTPKGGSLNTSLGNTGSGGGAILRPSMNSNNLEMLEYPFLTMTEYPPGFIVHIGGTVCARSVKLVDAGGESAARAAWWAELRTELRAHARALRCNAVIAYTEGAAICEDVCVLSASGTAAVINLDCDFNSEIDASISVSNGTKPVAEEVETETCSMAHVPYSPGTGPYRAELSTCGGCRRARVPAVLLATCAKPNKLPSYAKCVTVTAVAARLRRAPPASEPGARDISDQLPFLEYELHKLLIAKLRMQGANALFSLQTQIAIGERFVMALANGTAVRLAALPPPTPPRIKASETDKNALDIQRALWDSFTANKAANGYDIGTAELTMHSVLPEMESEDAPALDLCADKDACVLELDEAEDVETAKALAMRRMHMQVYSNSLKAQPAAPPYAFAQVWRARLTVPGQGGGASTAAERHVARALDGVTYKLRRLQPCALVAPRFQLELPEDEIQLVVSGAAIPLVDPTKPEDNIALDNISQNNGNTLDAEETHCADSTGDADDDIFTLDEEQLVKKEPIENFDEKNLIMNGQPPATVSLTSLSYVSGSRAARRVCALRLLFVRETTAVRELGGLSGFLHTFTCEVLAIVRAYTAALGGNVLTSFYITQLMLQDNAHKNQGQCLLSVGGDVVHITY